MRMSNKSLLLKIIPSALLLTGCSAADTAINHGQLTIQTHMSETVFLDPVPMAERTIYVSARNTSDHPELDIRGALMQAIMARGYQVTQDPDAAHYMLRVNLLQAGQIDTKSKGALLAANYGEPLLAGAVAAGGVSAVGGNAAASTATGLGVALASFAANQLVKDVTYSVVIDIQLSERPLKGGTVKQVTKTNAAQANGSLDRARTAQTMTGGAVSGTATLNSRVKSQEIEEQVDFKQYQIREVAYADQMNLKFEDAVPQMVTRLSSNLSNLFE